MRFKAYRRTAKCILLGLLCLFVATNGVSAHALLTRSVPEAGAELATAPTTIELWFSEPLEAEFSNAHLEDAQGNQIGNGESLVDTSDPTHMTLHVHGLTSGVYTVVYHSLSKADGHEWLGSFPLVLLNADGSRPAGAEAVVRANNTEHEVLPGIGSVFSRWLSLIGAMLLIGVLLFQQMASEPFTSQPDRVKKPVNATKFQIVLRRAMDVSMNFGGALLVIGGLWQILVMLQGLSENESLVERLLHTNSGVLLSARLVLTGLWLLFALLFRRQPTKGVQWMLLVVSLAILATFSAGSHAAAVTGSGWAMLGDFIHLGAAAVWLGGLTLLALSLWYLGQQFGEKDGITLRQVVQRFSTVATLAVFVLVCSGLFSSLVQLKPLSLLWTSTYGWVLLAKLGLMAITLLIALLNHRLVRAPARDTKPLWSTSQYRTFLRQVWGESLLGMAIMVTVAILVQTPILQASRESDKDYFETILNADDLTVHMQILPNQVGDNQYITHLYHADNSSIGEVQLVRLSFEHQTAQLGQSDLNLDDQGGGIFSGQGAYLNRAGPWNLSVYIRRRGMDDTLIKTTVAVPVPGEQDSGSQTMADHQLWTNPIPGVPPIALIGAVLLACLAALLLVHQIQKNA